MQAVRSAEDSIRVLVVDDHAIVREGVCALLEREPDIEVVGSAGSGEEAIELTRRTSPDVVVMDLGLPGISGVEATRKVKERSPDVQVLALTMYADDQYLLGMLDAGAAGYLLKQSMANELVQAVKSVSCGQCFLQPSAARIVVESLRRPQQHSALGYTLTNREKEILGLIGQGCTSKEIARKLFLSPKTVENYRARILEKMQVRNCSEAVSIAIAHRIIQPLP